MRGSLIALSATTIERGVEVPQGFLRGALADLVQPGVGRPLEAVQLPVEVDGRREPHADRGQSVEVGHLPPSPESPVPGEAGGVGVREEERGLCPIGLQFRLQRI